MAELLLIHGAGHGAWCWDRLIPALGQCSITARAIDLPGCGDDPTPVAEVTLGTTAAAILKACNGPTVLLGHSAGGFAITAAAQTGSSHLTGLIYLAAYVPRPGLTLAQLRRAQRLQTLRGGYRLSPDRASFSFDPATAERCFFHDCDPRTTDMALSRLTPQPLATQETALPATDRAMALPRHYIRTTQDRALPLADQTAMAGDMPVTDLPTGHSPFLSAPDALARHIAALMPRFA